MEKNKLKYIALVMSAYICGEKNALEHYQSLGHTPDVDYDDYGHTTKERDLDFVYRMAAQDWDDGEDNLVYKDLWDTHKYNQRARSLAVCFCPTIHPCAECKSPVVSGYCCTYCKSEEPDGTL